MVFDDRSTTEGVGIRPEDVERLVTMTRTEFPSDEMMVELHVLRSILGVGRGDVTLDEVRHLRAAT